MFHKVLIANRGEIAVRIIRACREMGIATVAVYSEVDRKSLHVRLADESYCIGKAPSTESYLRYSEIILTALECGAQAIHPGYGFLSENAEFADLCRASGIVFIGPSAECIRAMGDKAVARDTMSAAGIPVARGTTRPVSSPDEAVRTAARIGYPLLIKPAAGGGGKGMRIVEAGTELVASLVSSQNEARAAFGDDHVYLERFIPNARHVEFQILADNFGKVVHLGERECSVQRRHQKLIEEAPSPALDQTLRRKMGRTAIKAARAVDYRGVGTIEFLLTENHKYYFIEMNTRLQVEHPVTECVTGIDLVKSQIAVAAGQPLELDQRRIRLRGHAIECRINAEDPHHDFMPSPGKIRGLALPGGPGVRIDTHIYSGYEVPHHYDSLLAKCIVHSETRATAVARMKQALTEFSVPSITTTAQYLIRLLDHNDFREGDYTTNLVSQLKTDDEHHELKSFMQKLFDSFHRGPEE